MDTSGAFWTILGYLGAHFLLYAVIFRHTVFFAREKSIFFYHFFSQIILTVFLIVWLVIEPTGERWALLVAAFSLHGVYSLSFLELWSLSEGGYSLRILERLQQQTAPSHPDLSAVEALENLGRSKKQHRAQDLMRLGLAHERSGQYRLTVFGSIFAALLSVVAWPSNHPRAD